MILFRILEAVIGLACLVGIALVGVVIIAFARRGLLLPTSTSRMFEAKRPSFTAELVCIFRAIGTGLKWCNDPLAFEFCDVDAQIIILAWTWAYRIFGSRIPLYNIPFLCTRTIFLDNFILESHHDQIVILGAGLDARSYRLPDQESRNSRFFEVDAPASQELKKQTVAEVFASKPQLFTNPAYGEGRVTYIGCNFAEESFLDKLVENGFDISNNKTAILLEGVASYLTWPELKSTLSLIARCAPGTRFAMNCLENAGARSSTSKLLKKFIGEEWKFSLENGETGANRFEPLGFEMLQELSFDDAQLQLRVLDGLPKPELKSRLIFMKVAG